VSYDFEVATRRRPGLLEPLLERLGVEARLDGAFDPDRNVLVTRLGNPERTIDVEGPAGYEPDDLADDLDARFAAAVPGARWIAAIHLPGGYADPDDRWVLDLAVELARENDGAVWDPQAERVLWPESPPATRPRGRARAVPRANNQVHLTWYVPLARVGPDLPAHVLRLLGKHLRQGQPDRFGRAEPYQHRLERDGQAAFVDDWSIEAARHGLLTWAGAVQPWAGVVFFRRGDDSRLAPDLFVSISGDDAALRDSVAADGLADGLAGIADALDAVYAEAHLEPTTVEVTPTGALVSPFRNVKAQGWAGLPWDPTWLAWFGRPYADRLRPDLADHIDRETSRGFMIRTGTVPAPRDELRAVFPRLPPELVQEEWFLESEELGRTFARLRPAPEIPPLDE
jgi:hypothetical protein